MSTPEQALQTQLANLQTRCGKTLGELTTLIQKSGLTGHGEIRDMLKRDLGLGHGDANTLTHHFFGAQKAPEASTPSPAPTTAADVLDEIYVGPKAALRPIHEKLLGRLRDFGDFEISPKKGYVSLRRKKQFATVGPATNTRVEVGLNMKGVPATDRLLAQPPGGMCQYKVKVTDPLEVDDLLISWIRIAYDNAG